MKNFIILLCIFTSLLMAEKAFEINEEEYRYIDNLALNLKPIGDKGSNGHNYTEIYSYYFSHIKNKPLKLLEIGVYQGASVALWENYFTNAELHFIDITLHDLIYSSKRSHFHIADQANPNELLSVVNPIGQFDIIIDDGGHTMNQQIVSFQTLFPFLKSGGIYIVEDTHTSYWIKYGGHGSKQAPQAGINTAIQFFKDLIDDVNFIGASGHGASYRNNQDLVKKETNIYRKEILGIHFYDSLCFIIKR